VSNEDTFQFIVPDLQRLVKPGGVYVGVGPDQNFTYIAALKPGDRLHSRHPPRQSADALHVQGADRAVSRSGGLSLAPVFTQTPGWFDRALHAAAVVYGLRRGRPV
jgi:hypothetical protein